MRIFKKTIHWLLLIVVILMFLSGFGITNGQTVSNLTFGLLTKPLAFRLHLWLTWPFLILLILHMLYYSKIVRKK